MVSVPAGSRPVVVSVTFALQGTGDFPLVNHVFVITTRPLVIPRLENVSTVNTAPRERTVKFARLVTMVIPRVVSYDHRGLFLSHLSYQDAYLTLFRLFDEAKNTFRRSSEVFFL